MLVIKFDQSVKLVGGCFVPVSYKRRLFIPKRRL
jgi:hypothetical protein